MRAYECIRDALGDEEGADYYDILVRFFQNFTSGQSADQGKGDMPKATRLL